mgnify:CR=1 FL=1
MNRVCLGRNMDIFSHWLWSMALTRGKISWKISGPMGVLPDLLAFVPASLIAMMQGVERTRITDESVTSDLPIAWEIYQWTHSFFMVLVLFGAAYFILQRRGHENPKNMAWVFVIPWLFHIFFFKKVNAMFMRSSDFINLIMFSSPVVKVISLQYFHISSYLMCAYYNKLRVYIHKFCVFVSPQLTSFT